MARPYSDDLREKLLQAYDQGKGSLVELAERFGVSRGWAWKISATRSRTGQVERQAYRPGPRSRVDAEMLAELLRMQSDLTLTQLGAELAKRTGVSVGAPHLSRVVRRLGFRLKKSRSTPKSATPKQTGSGAKHSSKPSANSRRRG
jgi:transposase